MIEIKVQCAVITKRACNICPKQIAFHVLREGKAGPYVHTQKRGNDNGVLGKHTSVRDLCIYVLNLR